MAFSTKKEPAAVGITFTMKLAQGKAIYGGKAGCITHSTEASFLGQTLEDANVNGYTFSTSDLCSM